jgi:hypothetical protein
MLREKSSENYRGEHLYLAKQAAIKILQLHSSSEAVSDLLMRLIKPPGTRSRKDVYNQTRDILYVETIGAV